MKIKNTLLRKGLLLAVAGFAGVSSAGAAVTAPANGSLFIAFRSTDSDTSYIVNIGASSLYTGATSSFAVASGTGAALTNLYGAGWSTSENVSWSVLGYATGTITTAFASKERDNVTIQSTTYDVQSAGARNSTVGELSSIITNTTNGYSLQNAAQSAQGVVFNPAGVYQLNAAGAGYNYQVTRSGNDFGSLSGWSNIEGNFADGASGTVLDLYRFTGTSNALSAQTVNYVGNFSISSAGVITFNANAVPEPGVALLGAVGTVILLSGRRRRATTHA